MTKSVIIYLPKNIFSEIDAVTPLLLELHARGAWIETFFFDRTGYTEYTTSPFHQKVVNRVSRVWLGFGSNRFVRFLRLIQFLLMVLGFRVCGRRITFIHNAQPRKKHMLANCWSALIGGIAALGGRTYTVPGVQAPATALFLRRDHPDVLPRRAKLEGIRGTVRPEPAAALVYTELHKKFLRDVYGWQCSIEVIGLPRFYPAWQSAVKAEAGADLDTALAQLGLPINTPEFVTILLTYPSFVWFRPEHDFFALLREAIAHAREIFPTLPILLKAKPRYKTSDFWGEGKLQPQDGVYVCTCSLAALSTRSRVAISIHETTGVFDFLTQGVPVVEYADYSPEWTELFPTPSPWVGLPGFRLAQSSEDLIKALQDAKDGRLTADPVALSKELDHGTNLAPFGVAK